MCNSIKRLWYKDILTSIITFCCCYSRPYLHKEVPEGHKCRPVLGFGRPGLQHDVINVLRTVLWFDKPLSLPIDLMENLCKRTHRWHTNFTYRKKSLESGMCVYLTTIESNPWFLPMSKHFPQCYSKHPGITGMGEGTGLQALWSTPAKHRACQHGLGEWIKSRWWSITLLTRQKGLCDAPASRNDHRF